MGTAAGGLYYQARKDLLELCNVYLDKFIIEASIDIAGSKSVRDMFKLVVHDCFLCLSFTHSQHLHEHTLLPVLL